MIDVEYYKKIDEIFQAALELRPEQRPSFISEACEGNDALIKEVEALLASDECEWEILNLPAFEMVAPLLAKEQPDLSPEQRLGHYRINSLLGAGGMGQVYLAEDTRLSRKVALKLLPQSYTNDESRLRRFQQEARAASALNHPNILTIYDIWEIDNRHIIVTEYIEGETLRQRMKREKLSVEEAVDISIQVTSALWAAHQAGIIHRDIKPENIMLRHDGLIKVLDFGLAKLIEIEDFADQKDRTASAHESLRGEFAQGKNAEERGNQLNTEAGLLMGTLRYMSPEQLRGESLDARTDIFSLGVVIYEMCSGCNPFAAERHSDLIASILMAAPPPLQQQSPYITFELTQVIDKALRKDKEERFQTAMELRANLKSLKDKPTSGAVQSAISGTEQTSISTGHGTGSQDASFVASIVSQIKTHQAVSIAVLLIIIALVLLYAWRKYPYKGYTTFERIKINSIPGVDTSVEVAFSSDGKYLAYTTVKPGQQSIWLRELSTNNDRLLVPPSPIFIDDVQISPDASYVYYAIEDKLHPSRAIYRVPWSGGDSEFVLSGIAGDLALSPDSKRLAFIRRTGKRETALMIANTDGSEERVVAVHKRPQSYKADGVSWSPDGKVIACGARFSARPSYIAIVGIDVESGVEHQINTNTWRGGDEISWLPDGKGLLVSGKDAVGGPQQIWYLTYPEGEAHRITNDVNNYDGISLTGDGQSLATVQSEWRMSIWMIESNHRDSKLIATPNLHQYRFISIAPDGRIIFPSSATGIREIWIMDADGKAEKPLTANGRDNILSSVSPDGQYVVFSSKDPETNSSNIWRVNIDGSNLVQLTNGDDELNPRYSPDGQWIIYNSGSPDGDDQEVLPRRLWRIPSQGGEAVQLTNKPSAGEDISPDGKLIACRYKEDDNGEWKIAIFPFDGGNPIKIFNIASDAAMSIRWMPDGSGVTYSLTSNSVSNLWYQPVNGGTPRQLTNFTSEVIRGFDWSRDGKLVCSRGYISYTPVIITDTH